MHVRAMLRPEANGERFIGCAGHAWLLDIAD